MLTYDPGMTLTAPDTLPDGTLPAPVSCTVCHALTYDEAAHADYHTAVANADPLPLPENIVAVVD